MARPLLIIDFSGAMVRAALFPQGGGGPASFVSLPSAGSVDKDAAAALDAIRKEAGGDPAACSVFVGVDPSSVSMRVVKVPVGKREKINEMLPFELAGVLAADPGGFVLDNIPLPGGRAMAVAMEKNAVREYLDAFASAGVDPAWLGVAGFSIPGYLHETHPGGRTQAFIGPGFISVGRGGEPLFFNSYSGTEGLKLNLSYLAAEGIAIEEAYQAPDGPPAEKLMPGAAVTTLAAADGLAPEATGMAALALDVKKGRLSRTVNLRKGEFEYTKEKAAVVAKLRLTAALVIVIIALLLGDAYLRYASINSSLDAYRTRLRAEYTRLFPNEKVAVDELYQLSARMKQIEGETAIVRGGPGVLAVMEGLAKASGRDASMGIRLVELSIADGKIKATGEAASFDAANRFRNILAGERLFRSVQISDLKSEGAGAAFSLIINIS